MNFLDGIRNVLEFINNNWTAIIIIVILIISIVKKTIDFFSKSKEEQVEIAKKQIKEIMLGLVTNAEFDYAELVKSGSIKRSQVIEKVFAMYPVLAKVANQEEVVAWIDECINSALNDMKVVFENNSSEDNSVSEN